MCPTPVNQATPEDCKKGADIVSCSWGEDDDHEPYLEQYIKARQPPIPTQTLTSVSLEAWIKAGILPVFAVGNSGGKCKTTASPSDYTGVIGVGGTDKSDTLLEFSSRGPGPNTSNASNPLPYNPRTPSIVAPGLNIEGPAPSGNGYKQFSGTSQAAPHVAGAAALVLSAHPKLTATQVSELLLNSAETSTLQDPNGSDDCGGTIDPTSPNTDPKPPT